MTVPGIPLYLGSDLSRLFHRFLPFLVFLVFSVTIEAAVITVDPSGGGDATTIKGGLNLASDGDTVSVLAGSYDESPPLTMKAGVMVIGPGIGDGILQDDPLRAVIFSSNPTDMHPLVLFSGLTNSAILEGFEIKNYTRAGDTVGVAVVIENGGGILRHNLIKSNVGTQGGALALIMSTALVDGNFIRDNFSSSFGGGVFIDGGAPFLINNIIDNNDTSGSRGGGVYIKNSSVEITNNAINGNGATNLSPRLGGGIYVECSAASQPLISNNILSNNRFGAPADTGEGSAIYIETTCSSYAFFYNNVYGNTPPQLGGTLDDTLLPNNSEPFVIFHDDPLYVDVTLNDFHLRPGSLMVDKGNFFHEFVKLNDNTCTEILGVWSDFEGIPRPQAGQIPPEIQNVEFPAFTDEFGNTVENNTEKETWDPLPDIGTMAAYNIYRGLLSQLSASFYGTCETELDSFTGGTNFDTQFIDFDLPEVGKGFFYLFTGEDHTGCVHDLGVFEVNGESPLGDARFGPLQSDLIPRLDPANTCMLTCFDYF